MTAYYSNPKNHKSFELKGSLFTLTVLYLFHAETDSFQIQLKEQVQKSPRLFQHMPVIIDLQNMVDPQAHIDFISLQQNLRTYGLIPIGTRHGNDIQNKDAQTAGLALMSDRSDQFKSVPKQTDTTITPIPQTLLIKRPVRSGQQIYAKNANLVILAPVNHGAELLADGYIHVYSSLNGRALAGINGDKTARIFCQQLNAELVSIAGYYLLSEHLPQLIAPMIQVYLTEENKMQVEALNSGLQNLPITGEDIT